MPSLPERTLNENQRQTFSLTFRLPATDVTTSLTLPLGGATNLLSPGDLDALSQNLGQLTNAAVVSERYGREYFIADKNVVTWDDAHGAGSAVYLTYQNNNGERFSVAIPAPVKGWFGDDGVTVSRADARVSALIDAIANAVNATNVPANSYAFTGGRLTSRKFKVRAAGVKAPTTEPSGQ